MTASPLAAVPLRRVLGEVRGPAWWVSGRRPRLGWCYQGAPHTWLGSASAARRVAPATAR